MLGTLPRRIWIMAQMDTMPINMRIMHASRKPMHDGCGGMIFLIKSFNAETFSVMPFDAMLLLVWRIEYTLER
ncbi:MAG: hypothetical protein DRN25_05715 [Thermoplasmata archaeon]|nr:MAG: hypothetical protein DRN25_05715 [Thermoplasmata archaeon]